MPELINKLMPIHSPMMCGAIYAKKYMKVKDSIAFISPCIAKKAEIDDDNTYGYIEYNVTFDHLIKYLKQNPVANSKPITDEIEYGLGSIYPMPGGLKENANWLLGGEVFVRQMEGEKHMYHYLERNKDMLLSAKNPFLFLDALNCRGGCIDGTGIEEKNANSEEIICNIQKIKLDSATDSKKSPWSNNCTPAKRLAKLNKQFENLDLNDFIRHYTDKSSKCKVKEPTVNEENEIFNMLLKDTEEKRHINCGGCGYASCKQMVKAIYNGFNHKDNCVYYAKDSVMLEKKENDALLEEIARAHETTKAEHQVMLREIDEKISAHILRHTGCTRMAESGMDMKVVQYLMKHAHMDVTMDAYNHIKEQSRIETELAKLNSAVV